MTEHRGGYRGLGSVSHVKVCQRSATARPPVAAVAESPVGRPTLTRPPAVDWRAIERDYRISGRSVRSIAAAHGVTHVAVLKRARRQGWSRHLPGCYGGQVERAASLGAHAETSFQKPILEAAFKSDDTASKSESVQKFRSPTDKPVYLALTSGQTLIIGTEPTYTPSMFHRSAVMEGCIPVGVDRLPLELMKVAIEREIALEDRASRSAQ